MRCIRPARSGRFPDPRAEPFSPLTVSVGCHLQLNRGAVRRLSPRAPELNAKIFCNEVADFAFKSRSKCGRDCSTKRELCSAKAGQQGQVAPEQPAICCDQPEIYRARYSITLPTSKQPTDSIDVEGEIMHFAWPLRDFCPRAFFLPP